jgi:hypothetical protein
VLVRNDPRIAVAVAPEFDEQQDDRMMRRTSSFLLVVFRN